MGIREESFGSNRGGCPKLVARLASDTMNTPVLMARTDANAAALLTNDFDDRDAPFDRKRTPEGFLLPNQG